MKIGCYITDIYDKLFGKDIYYLYAMTAYHILIPIWVYYYGFNRAMTFVTINAINFGQSTNIMSNITLQNGFYAVMWGFVVVVLDFFFLFILKHSFHLSKITLKLWNKRPKEYTFLSYKNIAIIELIIFAISFYSVALRELMFFMSFNTMQITITYFLIRKIPFSLGKILFISAAYIFIIKLLIFPIFN